jgi:hypothetical protein
MAFKLVCVRAPAADCLTVATGSAAHGTVRVDVKASGFTMTVTVMGLTPNTSHLINYHTGTCANPDLSLWRQLDVATADAKGTFTWVSTWPDAYFIPADGQVLTIHYAEPNRSRAHIACADMTN